MVDRGRGEGGDAKQSKGKTSGSLSSLWGIKDEGVACGKGEEAREQIE